MICHALNFGSARLADFSDYWMEHPTLFIHFKKNCLLKNINLSVNQLGLKGVQELEPQSDRKAHGNPLGDPDSKPLELYCTCNGKIAVLWTKCRITGLFV